MITCTFEDGVVASLRHIVVDTILEKDGKILLVKRSPKLIMEPGKWSTPGGYVDRDETLSEAAKREIREETGYSVKNLQLFRINSSPLRPREGNRQNVAIVFLAEAEKTTGETDWEVTETKWFGCDELPSRESVAFDHYENLELYRRWKKEKFSLPILQ